MADPACILVDWGTTNFRAWLVGAAGNVIDRRNAASGLLQVPEGGFAAALHHQVGPWRTAHPALPVLMSGMVGGRQGWTEAPYVPCPADATDLAKAVVDAPGETGVRIVPGISYQAPDGRHDVMRGEEVQILGALKKGAEGGRVFCLPGTHSKWASVDNGRIDWFATSMTGEVYSVMLENTILGRLIGEGSLDDVQSFRKGLALAAKPGGLLNHLFAVRADGLFGTVPESGLRSYLSGILIGHETRAIREVTGLDGPITLIGRPDITGLYGEAIARAGYTATAIAAEEATLNGLFLMQEAMTND